MSYKIAITKAGYNVLTETNPDNIIFSSDYNTLKYFFSGSASISITGDSTDLISEVEITHGLGYVPFFIVYVNDFINAQPYSIVPSFANTISIFREAHAYADTNKIYLRMRNKSANAYTANFYYKVFKNNLGL